ncbi:MAG: GAF domain-containing sensor histidine kinase [Ignavibacteriaceae bacterium]
MTVKNGKNQEKIRQLENELCNYQAALAELKLLNDIAVAAGRAVNVDQILRLILNRTVSAVEAEHGSILLVSENREVLKTFIKHDDSSKIEKVPHIGEHITGWVLVNKKSLIIKNLSSDNRFNATEQEKKTIRSLICSPIWFEGKIIGILQMINKTSDIISGNPSSPLFTENDLTLLSIISMQAGQLIKNSELQLINFEKKQEAENSRLRAEKAELQAKEIAVEKEINEEKIRRRIAADLHDEIASNLSSISLFSKIIQEELGKNPEIVSQFLERISVISQESINSIRDIIWAIDPKPEVIYDLILRIKDTYVSICRASSILFDFNIPEKEYLPPSNLSPEQRKNLWLILKEALNNSVKHSSCSELSFLVGSLEDQNNNINITIKDNGKGFEPSSEFKGKGLSTMKKRADAINADLSIASCSGEGTLIKLSLKI